MQEPNNTFGDETPYGVGPREERKGAYSHFLGQDGRPIQAATDFDGMPGGSEVSPANQPMKGPKPKRPDSPKNYELQTFNRWDKPKDPLFHIARKTAFKQGAGMVGMKEDIFNAIAQFASQNDVDRYFFDQAKSGNPPDKLIDHIFDYKDQQAEVARKFEANQAAALSNRLVEPEGSDVDETWNAYQKSLNQSPVAEPILKKARIGDAEAIIGLATVLLGGLGIAPDVLTGLSYGAKRVADEENEDAQTKYRNDVNNQNANIDALKTAYLKSKSDRDLEAQKRKREYEERQRGFVAKDTELTGQAQKIEAIQSDIDQVVSDSLRQFPKSTDWSDKAINSLHESAIQIARRYPRPDELPSEFEQRVTGIYRAMRQQAGEAVSELAKREKREAMAFSFVHKPTADYAGMDEDGKVNEINRQMIEQLLAFKAQGGTIPERIFLDAILNDTLRKSKNVPLDQKQLSEKKEGNPPKKNKASAIGQPTSLSGTYVSNDPNAIAPLTQAQKKIAIRQISEYAKQMKGFPKDEAKYTEAQLRIANEKSKLESLVYGGSVPLEPKRT